MPGPIFPEADIWFAAVVCWHIRLGCWM